LTGVREREGLIARIRQVRRAAAAEVTSRPDVKQELDSPEMRALETRIAHLEQLVEALQDSVHRLSERHEMRIAELEARTQPAALSVALSRDARERGL
jgi:vacuolar-type H+-ATPase subunit I/STV1